MIKVWGKKSGCKSIYIILCIRNDCIQINGAVNPDPDFSQCSLIEHPIKSAPNSFFENNFLETFSATKESTHYFFLWRFLSNADIFFLSRSQWTDYIKIGKQLCEQKTFKNDLFMNALSKFIIMTNNSNYYKYNYS